MLHPITAAEPPSRTLAWALVVLALVLSMLLSARTLELAGIQYESIGGPPIVKIHPGSYVFTLAWLVALCSHGNPLRVLLRQLRANPLLSCYFICMLLVFAWVILRHGSSGAAYIIQTLWMPAVALYTLALLPPRRHRQAVQLMMLLLACNAVLALGEYGLKRRLVPIDEDVLGLEYFRATAFLGHPLANANVTMALLPAVTLLPWQPRWRGALALLLLTSALAYGARSALVFGVLLYGSFAIAAVLANTVRGRYSYLQLTGGSVALLAGASALAGLVLASGLGTRIFQNLTLDNSARVRLQAWQAFDYLRDADWWLGIPPLQIDRIAIALGLDPRYEAIENFWVYMYLQFGAIGYVPFLVGIASLAWLMCKRSALPMRLAVLLFFLVASTANALASKSVAFTLLAVAATAGAAATAGRHRAAGLLSMRHAQ